MLWTRSTHGSPLGWWELSLLSFALAAGIFFIAFGTRVTEIIDYDSAYYYGVARHMVSTGRFEEPIVWHFLHPPDRILHAPFDYWGCMTTLLLIPFIAVLGSVPQSACIAMSAIAALSVVSFWYLITVAVPFRYRLTQLVALVLFAFSPALDHYRFQPESVVVAQLFLLLSLIALCTRNFLLAVVSGFCIMLTRSDGLLFFAPITAVALIATWRAGAPPPRRAFQNVLMTALLCVVIYVSWSVVSFGTLVPPGPQRLPLLDRYEQVFDYENGQATRAPDAQPAIPLTQRVADSVSALRQLRFTPQPDLWLVLAGVGLCVSLRARRGRELGIGLLCFGVYLALILGAGPGFNPHRAPYVFVPLLIFAGALGFDAVLAALNYLAYDGLSRRMLSIPASFAVLVLCWIAVYGLTPYHRVPGADRVSAAVHLAPVDQLLDGDAVASNNPFYMIAYTRSPAVSIPHNGEAAIAAVFDRYDVQWLVTVAGLPLQGASRDVLANVTQGRTDAIGDFRLERIRSSTRGFVFRVSRARPPLP